MTFKSNSALNKNGGALYLENVKNLTMTYCSFSKSYAKLNGGAMYFSCNGPEYDCFVTLSDYNEFESSTALGSGGAMYWSDVEPTMDFS